MLQVQYCEFSLNYFPIGRKRHLIFHRTLMKLGHPFFRFDMMYKIFLDLKYFSFEPPTLSPYKNGTEWLKYECSSDIINFRSLLLKADFRIFHFELETPLNKLVKLYSYLFLEK